ncbi:TIGR00289 family protein [Thermogymnomonas acidicola]|uniref:TIGR00289 family protein n=2 Tax=Thermogymnomonas acidicola TaxID=399579 RepID=A0AA37BRL0_9ARCH|nr:TIGR00289 family protein [Thermogymnomonas acidicola]
MSGGKDSFLATLIALESGFDVVMSVTVIAEEHSLMYHYPNASMARYVSGLLGIENVMVEEGKLWELIGNLARDGIGAVVVGAIASDYQKTRVEMKCTELGILMFAPLWRKDQGMLLNEIVMRSIDAILVSVSAEGLTEDHLGMHLDRDGVERIMELSRKYGMNPSGEGGEYESFVLSFPGAGRIRIRRSHRVWRGSGGYLIIDDAGLDQSSVA